MVYIILGMHKSGTTLISETLHKSGIYMGEDYDEKVTYYFGNQYEPLEVNEINNDILRTRNQLSLSITDKHSHFNNDIKSRIKDFIERMCASNVNWGIKDPRLCLTYSLWKNYLPEHKIVVVYRHPKEVFKHYFRKNYVLDKFKSLKAFYIWKIYNRHILDILQKKENDFLIVNYNKFMKDDRCIKKLEKFVDINLVDCRKPKSEHQKNESEFLLKVLNNLFTSKEIDHILNCYMKAEQNCF